MRRVGVVLAVAVLLVGIVSCTGTSARYTLTISSSQGGTVTTPGEGTFTYAAGTAVHLVVEADAGYQFVNWTGENPIGDVRAATATIVMNGDYSVTANFAVPTLVRNWYDLNAIRDGTGGVYILMNNLSSSTPGYEQLAGPAADGGKGWQPIGLPLSSANERFHGTLDGQGYDIRDLVINRPDEWAVGLFATVARGGGITDLGVVNAAVSGHDDVGALVGQNRGTVTNCHSVSSVNGTTFVGGLIGGNGPPATVSNSYSAGTVTGHRYVGGLIGANGAFGSTVTNCYSDSSVNGSFDIGGLIGYNGGNVIRSYSAGDVAGNGTAGGLVGYNDWGTVVSSYYTGSVSGNTDVGGLVGTNRATVSNSYSTGRVAGGSCLGGLVGDNDWGTVVSSYCTGNVSGGSCVGGLVGANGSYGHGTVSDSYSNGTVTGDTYVGGLVADNNGTVTGSFWDTQASGQSYSAGGTGKITAEMRDVATFSAAGWNIITVALNHTDLDYAWNIVANTTCPFLGWFLGCHEGHTFPIQLGTGTVPGGYFGLTVSPAEVCAGIGEHIEIYCDIDSLTDCGAELTSVDVLLFDSGGSLIRTQAMTKDSYWSVHTAYTIVGDEAYFKIQVNSTFCPPGNDAEYGIYSFPIIVKS